MKTLSKAGLLGLVAAFCGCTDGSQILPVSSSSLTSISLGLPSKETFPAQQKDLLSGYSLAIKPQSSAQPGCSNPTQVDGTKPWSSASLMESLVQGCDYTVSLSLGSLASDGRTLTKIFYTNTDNGGGYSLKAAEFGNAAHFNMKLSVKITNDGMQAGFGSIPGAQANASTDLQIDAKLDNGGSTLPVQPPNPPPTVPQNPPAQPQLREIAINVSSTGYTPSSFSLAANESVKLVVTKSEAGGCGGTIVFPDYNISKDLTVGQPVEIVLPGKAAGTFRFTCGMGMYKGEILVQ